MNVTPEQMLKLVGNYAKNIADAKRSYVAVGLPSEKVGGKVYGDGMTVIRLGAIHEYGKTFTHPGGTPYMSIGGKAVFVKKSFSGPVSGVTKPHTITIPRRSFLHVPFTTKKKTISKVIDNQFNDVLLMKSDAKKALELSV